MLSRKELEETAAHEAGRYLTKIIEGENNVMPDVEVVAKEQREQFLFLFELALARIVDLGKKALTEKLKEIPMANIKK